MSEKNQNEKRKSQPDMGMNCAELQEKLLTACHSSRAIHLELMMDRTPESFILTIKRMSNR